MAQLPTQEDVAAALPAGEVRGLLVLQLALAAGPLMFAGVVLALPFPAPAQAPEGPFPPPALSLAHAVLTLGVWGAALVLPAAQLRQAGRDLCDHPPVDAATAAALWIGQFRARRILVLALLEGAALFGVVLLFLARSSGALAQRPELYAHLLPLGVLLAYALGSLPTPEAIGRSWRRHVLEAAV